MYVERQNLLARPESAAPQCGRIAYIPHEDMGNAYTERMREILATLGTVERFAGIKRLLLQLPRSLFHYDAVVVNWLDNAIVDHRSGRISLRGTAVLFAKTLLMKAFTRRMVFVRHNNYPHHTAAGSVAPARRLTDFYCRLFDVVVTHSGAGVGARRNAGTERDGIYCPHPLYRRTDEPPQAKAVAVRHEFPSEYFLVFGRIVPYKKIDALVEAFPPQRTLVVAGIVGDAAYAEKLASLRRPNFIFLPGRLDEARAQQLVRSARGMVIANADADVVVSGTFFYALSLGCPVFAVTTPFLEWVRQRIDDDLLVLGPDLRRLCRSIAKCHSRRPSIESRESVQHEFGDAAVRSALASALRGRAGA